MKKILIIWYEHPEACVDCNISYIIVHVTWSQYVTLMSYHQHFHNKSNMPVFMKEFFYTESGRFKRRRFSNIIVGSESFDAIMIMGVIE